MLKIQRFFGNWLVKYIILIGKLKCEIHQKRIPQVYIFIVFKTMAVKG